MTSETERTRDALSVSQSFQIMKLIEQNGAKEGEFWVYSDGWDDARIAREIKCQEASVAYRRKEAFGHLRVGRSGPSPHTAQIEELRVGAQAQRVSTFKLEKRIEALEKTVNILLTAPNRDIMQDKLSALKQHYDKVS